MGTSMRLVHTGFSAHTIFINFGRKVLLGEAQLNEGSQTTWSIQFRPWFTKFILQRIAYVKKKMSETVVISHNKMLKNP